MRRPMATQRKTHRQNGSSTSFFFFVGMLKTHGRGCEGVVWKQSQKVWLQHLHTITIQIQSCEWEYLFCLHNNFLGSNIYFVMGLCDSWHVLTKKERNKNKTKNCKCLKKSYLSDCFFFHINMNQNSPRQHLRLCQNVIRDFALLYLVGKLLCRAWRITFRADRPCHFYFGFGLININKRAIGIIPTVPSFLRILSTWRK